MGSLETVKTEIDTELNENLNELMDRIRIKMLERVNQHVKNKECELKLYIIDRKPFNSFYGYYSPALDNYLAKENIVRVSFLSHRDYHQYLYRRDFGFQDAFLELLSQKNLFFDVKLNDLEKRLTAEGLESSTLGSQFITIIAQLPVYEFPPKEVVYVLTRNPRTGKNIINRF